MSALMTKRFKICDSTYMTVPPAIFEKFRCSVCTEYLYCPPIQVLPDGKSICGNCRTSDSPELGHRSSTLETMLSKVRFPCKYQDKGCKQLLPFEEAYNHVCICYYQGFPCPLLECPCKEPILLSGHFTDKHRDLVSYGEAKFKLDVEENKEAIIMVVVENVNFLLKYKYNATACELYYDLRYLRTKEVSCRIQLLNSSDDNYNICVRANSCQAYDYSFNNPEISNSLIMSNLLPILNQPNQVIVVMTLSLSGSTETDLVTCTGCEQFLSIPFFENDGVAICDFCHNEYWLPACNEDLVNHVANSRIPCRWKCEEVKYGNEILKHEKKCYKRLFEI